MALSVCSGCRRHVREGEACPFCGTRPRTTMHVWKAAVLTAMVPLGLAACYGVPPTPEPDDARKSPPTQKDPTTPQADPSPSDPGGQGAEPEPEPTPEPEPEPTPEANGESGDGENTKPDGTDTPIAEEPRPAKKYGAPPRPSTKYGGPPKPLDPPKPLE